jgi:hypothetical protein
MTAADEVKIARKIIIEAIHLAPVNRCPFDEGIGVKGF